MKLLRDFPAIRADRPPASAHPGGFPHAEVVPAGQEVAAAAKMLSETEAPAIVIIDRHMTPEPKAELIDLPEALFSEGVVIGFPGRSIVSGMFLTLGLRVVPRARLQDADGIPPVDLVLPRGAGRFGGNGTPEDAFETGHAMALLRQSGSEARRALYASLGADVLNGAWWVLGGLAALAGDTVAEGWARHSGLLDRPADIPRHVSVEARRVRQRTGLNVRALDADQSRSLKAMQSDWPDEDMWRDFARDCERLGAPCPAVLAPYLRAMREIWPLTC